ncbi:MAG: BadF/BadG/BcrA/BcrD ATPase family protein [Coprothermobacterota bacterium]|nr:BadF/BadG/BcrA/BcrD ATPase family protein [Coprothermobacterota bacterium]
MIFLGVDGGGSKTAALICDEKGNVLGEGHAGPSNYQIVGMEFALGEISRAVEEALKKGGVSLEEIQRAVFGLSGADLPENFRELEEGLKKTFPGLSFLLVNDTWIALRAGAKKGWGVCIVCGSGANACARSPSGEWFTLAGLGYESGLGGGGLDMVRDVLHFSFRAVQGTGPQTALVPAVLEEMGVESFEELSSLLLKVMASPASALLEMERALGIIPRVFQLASEGDWASQEILVKHGSHLGEVAGYLAKKLKEEEVDVVLQGGVFKGECPIFLDAFNLALHRITPFARTVFPELPPVFGAILLAMEER